MKIKLSIIIGVLALTLGLAVNVFATSDKVSICHYDGQSGNYQTLNIAQAAADEHLEQHENDYEGPCEEASPSVSPSATPDPCDEPEEEWYEEEPIECPSPSPEVSPSPSVEPSPEPSPVPCEQTEEGCPSPTPEASPTPQTEEHHEAGNTSDVCNGIPIGSPAWVHIDKVASDNTARYLEWVNINGNEAVSILYGEVGNNLHYSEVDLPGSTTTRIIRGLQPNILYNWKVLNWSRACVSGSEIIDP